VSPDVPTDRRLGRGSSTLLVSVTSAVAGSPASPPTPAVTGELEGPPGCLPALVTVTVAGDVAAPPGEDDMPGDMPDEAPDELPDEVPDEAPGDMREEVPGDELAPGERLSSIPSS
jgi:hypothetical protein